jgi:hypothetical protein
MKECSPVVKCWICTCRGVGEEGGGGVDLWMLSQQLPIQMPGEVDVGSVWYFDDVEEPMRSCLIATTRWWFLLSKSLNKFFASGAWHYFLK